MDQSDTMNLSVTGDVPGGLYNYVDNNIVPELEKLTGVASVSTYGGQQEYVSITLNSEALQQYGLTMSSVVSAVSTADFSMPAGDVDVGTLNLSVSTGMSYKTLESLKNIPISGQRPGGFALRYCHHYGNPAGNGDAQPLRWSGYSHHRHCQAAIRYRAASVCSGAPNHHPAAE